jgi:hypothetical protein
MDNELDDYYNDITENYDCEIKLPDFEFDELVRTFEERKQIKVENPEKLIFYVEKDAVRYKVIRKNDGSITH